MSIYVFNDDKGPLFSAPVKSPLEYLSSKGRLFSVTSGSLSTLLGQFALLLLTNPVGSGVNLHIQSLIVSTTSAGTAHTIINGTATGSTDATPVSLNTGSSLTPQATAGFRTGANISGGSLISVQNYGGNSNFQIDLGGGLIIAPGGTVGTSITSTVANTAALTMIWSELPIL